MNTRISSNLQFVCETLDLVIDDKQEREWVDARIRADIEAGVDHDALARELADDFRIQMPY